MFFHTRMFFPTKMFFPIEMPINSVSVLFFRYASFASILMLLRSMANELLRLLSTLLCTYLLSAFINYFSRSSTLTLVIDKQCSMDRNQVYDAAETYLRTKISLNNERLSVSKTHRQENFSVAIEKGEEITDRFENFQLTWRFFCELPQREHSSERRWYELSFNKKFKDKVLHSYLPHVLSISEKQKVVKLYNLLDPHVDRSIDLEHPFTFDTLAMDPELKKSIIDDLDRFVRRKEYYKKVRKAWKRGYLLYGPPGTGKSSLIAAMANYLKFDIYDLELTSMYANSNLRSVLLSTSNRSILVIEDIDCSMEMQDRQNQDAGHQSSSKLKLLGLLNIIDGLWSSCWDERIIVFTTNHKDWLDPALLRPGRMDVHINMSYCTSSGFKILASNYLGLHDPSSHQLYGEIESLIVSTEVTPTEVVEELMKSDDANVAFAGLVNFLKLKKAASEEVKEGSDKNEEDQNKNLNLEGCCVRNGGTSST